MKLRGSAVQSEFLRLKYPHYPQYAGLVRLLLQFTACMTAFSVVRRRDRWAFLFEVRNLPLSRLVMRDRAGL